MLTWSDLEKEQERKRDEIRKIVQEEDGDEREGMEGRKLAVVRD